MVLNKFWIDKVWKTKDIQDGKIILIIIKNGWIQNMLMEGLSKVSNQSNGWAQELKDKMKNPNVFLLTCIELV